MKEADTRLVTHLLRDTSAFKIGTRGDFFSFRFLSCFPVLRCRNFRSAYSTVVLVVVVVVFSRRRVKA